MCIRDRTPGSSVLLGGEPGIGKSTLLLQAAVRMAAYGKVLYISGEEAAEQIKLRYQRIMSANDEAVADNIYLLAQTEDVYKRQELGRGFW